MSRSIDGRGIGEGVEKIYLTEHDDRRLCSIEAVVPFRAQRRCWRIRHASTKVEEDRLTSSNITELKAVLHLHILFVYWLKFDIAGHAPRVIRNAPANAANFRHAPLRSLRVARFLPTVCCLKRLRRPLLSRSGLGRCRSGLQSVSQSLSFMNGRVVACALCVTHASPGHDGGNDGCYKYSEVDKNAREIHDKQATRCGSCLPVRRSSSGHLETSLDTS